MLYMELSADNKFSKQIYRVFNTEQVHILVALLFESEIKCTSIIPDLSAIVGQLELTQDFDYTPLNLYITLSLSFKGLLLILKENVTFYSYLIETSTITI